MKNTFEKRMLTVLQYLKSRKALPSENRKYLKSVRCGNYLIKVSKNNKLNWCGADNQYIDYTYLQRGWFALSTRENAQWFTGIEAQEFIKGKKGFYIVRRKKD